MVCQLQDAIEYAKCEAVVKNYPPFIEAMRKRGGGYGSCDGGPLILQPEGPRFRINDHFVEWQKWSNNGQRPVAHRLSFVEMVVPYADPEESHYRKIAFDAGEDVLGKNTHSHKRHSCQFKQKH